MSDAPPTDEGGAPETDATQAPAPARGAWARFRAFVQHDKVKAAWARVRGGELTPGRAAASVAVGVLVGTTPLYGLHFFLVMGICLPLKLDAAVAYVASNVSLPIFAPFINITEIQVGAYLRTGSLIHLERADFDARGPLDYARELALGTLVVSPVSAALAACLTYAVGWVSKRRRATSESAAKA
jgi:uncharacterized protein (DUF2062 family)